MTIFIEDFIRAGYCKRLNGKIVGSPDCPGDARKELAGIDEMWLAAHPDAGSIVIFMAEQPQRETKSKK